MIANDSTQNDSPSVLVPSAEEQASLGMLLIKTPEQGMTASLIEWSVVKTVLCQIYGCVPKPDIDTRMKRIPKCGRKMSLKNEPKYSQPASSILV